MGSKHLVVAGNGETTRVNVEALLEDYFRGNGKDFILLLPFKERPSQGQVWAHQLASEMGIPTTVVAPEGAILMSISSSSFVSNQDPIKATVDVVSGEWATAFLFWDESDVFTASLLLSLKEASVPSYDLCKGLLEISAGNLPETPQEAPKEPAEVVKVSLDGPRPDFTINNLPVIVSEDLSKAIGKAVAKAVTEVLEKYGISG
jgi:hypothetical protein